MAEIHYFDVKIAEKYGVNCAILLQHIALAVGHRVSKEFDKSGFDKLVQLGKLLFSQGNQFANRI